MARKGVPNRRWRSMVIAAAKDVWVIIGHRRLLRYLFGSIDGRPCSRFAAATAFARAVLAARKALGDDALAEISIHGLRHTHASILLRHGVPLIDVAERLELANPTITLRVYGHVLPGAQEELAARMDSMASSITFGITGTVGRVNGASAHIISLCAGNQPGAGGGRAVRARPHRVPDGPGRAGTPGTRGRGRRSR